MVTYFDPFERFVVNKFSKKKNSKHSIFFIHQHLYRGIILGKGNIFGPWSLLENRFAINQNCLFLTNSVLKSGNSFVSKLVLHCGIQKINKILKNRVKIFENYFNNSSALSSKKNNANYS